MISRGEMMKLVNEPYKLGTCRKCSKYPARVGKEEGLCRRCKIKIAPIVEGLLFGYHKP